MPIENLKVDGVEIVVPESFQFVSSSPEGGKGSPEGNTLAASELLITVDCTLHRQVKLFELVANAKEQSAVPIEFDATRPGDLSDACKISGNASAVAWSISQSRNEAIVQEVRFVSDDITIEIGGDEVQLQSADNEE